MKKHILAILIISMSFVGCKDEKKAEEEQAPKVDNFFKATFDLVIKKDDDLHLYYTEDGTLNFNEKNSVWAHVKGSDAVQAVTFNLPEGAVPTHLRVDFGSGVNEQQSDVEIKTFTMNYFDKKVVANGLSFFDYFYINESNTAVDKGTSILKRLDKKQNGGPMVYPQALLTQKIQEMTKG
jgi:hypothetical protein